MFSEHCSYKSSKPSSGDSPHGKACFAGPGRKRRDHQHRRRLGVAFKMESHNHPSFIEPYQGAATGVGGILRDIFTMGARPIASMNGLSFGMPDFEKTRSVVKGCREGDRRLRQLHGRPDGRGPDFFPSLLQPNPLVNAFTIGLVKEGEIYLGVAKGIGNAVVYVGAKTGRDGVHGATMASQEFSTEKEPERPAVQVGDPFTEKLLLEATLEAMKAGAHRRHPGHGCRRPYIVLF